jgi:hypothetical protein
MVAAVGGGWFPTVAAAMAQMTTPGPLVYPEPAAVRAYQAFWQSGDKEIER